ncbi:MAG: carboxynorspermidine decarboxylase, partial [Clostridia bacterium]|nr:carboxynorspermidine decarboxylase [Clostridia bacterium]
MRYEELPTPCYVIDQELLEHNLRLLFDLSRRSGAKILLAQKAFSMFSLYPLIGRYLAGTASSGLFEARLGREEMGGESHVYAPAYREEEIEQIARLADHIIFNSFGQLAKYSGQALAGGAKIGLRINPERSTQSIQPLYDPCAPGSRLGVTAAAFAAALAADPRALRDVSGLHFHTLCEQNADALALTLDAVEEKFGRWLSLPQMEWLNLGGGQLITNDDYDLPLLEALIRRMRERYGVTIYLEPGEAVALKAGFLQTTVLDIIRHDRAIAILDASAACHMPDVLEMPYRPPLPCAGLPGAKPYTYRLAGPTCLAGDVIGDYSFDAPLAPGDRLSFSDMAIYTMVKNNTFNGVNLPAIALREPG